MPLAQKMVWGLSVGLVLFSPALRADFERDSYRDVRMLGRGNTGIADVVGGEAAFYNPAGLADSRSFSFVPLNFALGANKYVATSVTDITSLTSSNQTLSQKFSPLLGKPLALQGTFFPHVAVPGFMVGFYDYADVNIEYRDPVFPRLDLGYRNDWGLIFGTGLSLAPGIQIGGSVRYMKRSSLDEELNMASVFNLTGAYLKEIMRKGEAWGINVGARAQHDFGPSTWMALGVVLEDIGGTKFKNANRAPLPETQTQKLNAGWALGTRFSQGEIKLLFDTKELDNSEKSFTKKIFTGAEISTSFISFRTGLFQGYWTAGITTTLIPLFELDITTYGEELASSAGLRESRYWMLGIRSTLDLKRGKRKKQRYTLDHL